MTTANTVNARTARAFRRAAALKSAAKSAIVGCAKVAFRTTLFLAKAVCVTALVLVLASWLFDLNIVFQSGFNLVGLSGDTLWWF